MSATAKTVLTSELGAQTAVKCLASFVPDF